MLPIYNVKYNIFGVSIMKVINENIKSPTAVRIKPAAVKNSPETGVKTTEHRRDHADFDREVIKYARKIKSTVKNEFDVKQPERKPSITSEEISAEIERLKAREKRPTAASETEVPEIKAPETAAGKTSETSSPTKDTSLSEAAKKLAEQRKQISELLAKHSGAFSKNITKQLETIYDLLAEQEKTDPNSISERLQKEIDKLSEIIDSEKPTTEKSISELLEEQRDRLNSLFSKNENKSNNLSSIRNKIQRGLKLTPSEQRYLSSKDPKAYESYCAISSARSMFRCSLHNCRTRDEVISMRLSNALTALSSYKKALREGGNGEMVIALNAAFENELKSFAKSPGYRSLPTAAECNKFDRDLAKAKRYEQEKRLEKQREAQRLRSKRYKKVSKNTKVPGDGKRTVAQVMADPTSKKVLASRAKRTYCECGTVGVSPYKSLNSKA